MILRLPFAGFGYINEYADEYEDALNGWTLGTPNVSLTALLQTGATSIETTMAYGIDPVTGTVYADTPGSVWNANASEASTGAADDEIATIKAAVADGLSVMVKPSINLLGDDAQATYVTGKDQYGDTTTVFANTTAPGGGSYYPGEFRADYTPTAGTVATFFSTYQTMIDQEAQIALAGGATSLSLGTELNPALTGAAYATQWGQIIASVKQIDPGLELTYSAAADYYDPKTGQYENANNTLAAPLLSQLDFIGVDDYLPLAQPSSIGHDPSEADLVKAWTDTPQAGTTLANATGGLSPVQYFENMVKATGKPLIFTEIGYQNDAGAAVGPDGYTAFQGQTDPSLQAKLYQAFFDVWSQQSNLGVAGAYFWNWDPLESDDNADEFSPEHNPAALSAATSGFQSIATPVVIDLSASTVADPLVNSSTIAGSSEVVIEGHSTVTPGAEGGLTLSGLNSYTGGTLIVDGVVGLGSATALGNGGLFLSTGATLNLDGFSQVLPTLDGGGSLAANAVAPEAAATVTLGVGEGYFSGTLDDGPAAAGLVDRLELVKTSSATLTLTGTSAFTGGTSLEDGTLEIGAAGSAGSGSIDFGEDAGQTRTLMLDGTAPGTGGTPSVDGTFQNVLDHFADGDAIDIRGLAFDAGAPATTSLVANPDLTSTLNVTSDGETISFTLANPGAATYYARSDDAGGTVVSDAPACFCRGTMILTPAGEVPVEALKIGDFVTTLGGEAKPVRWIGTTTVSARFGDPLRVLPIRIAAGALGEGVPNRDLDLSADHAVLIDHALVQAGALVNVTTITRRSDVPERFAYYHVELAEHAILLANGTPAESFVDNTDRLGFDNWAEHQALYGEEGSIAELPYPRAKSHRQVPMAIRARLVARAAEISTVHRAA